MRIIAEIEYDLDKARALSDDVYVPTEEAMVKNIEAYLRVQLHDSYWFPGVTVKEVRSE